MSAAADPLTQIKASVLEIFQNSFNATSDLVDKAFAAGLAAGKNQAANELREKLAGVLSLDVNVPEQPAEEGRRAARGTVKPAVIETLKKSKGTGLRPSDISERTGLNENSVRGALNNLSDEGVTTKQGDLWFLA